RPGPCRVRRAGRAPVDGGGALGRARLEGLAQHLDQSGMAQIALREIARRPRFQRVDGEKLVAGIGEDDDRRTARPRGERLEPLEPRFVRNGMAEQHRIATVDRNVDGTPNARPRRMLVEGRARPFDLDVVAQQPAELGVVIDQQDPHRPKPGTADRYKPLAAWTSSSSSSYSSLRAAASRFALAAFERQASSSSRYARLTSPVT